MPEASTPPAGHAEGRNDARWHFAESSYQAEWRHLAEVTTGGAAPSAPLEEIVADPRLALAIGEGAARLILEQP